LRIGKITDTAGAVKSFITPPAIICAQYFPAHNLG